MLSTIAAAQDLFARAQPFDVLTADEREALLQKLTFELYAPGEVIVQQGDDVHRALFVVQEGLVRLADGESNRTVDLVGAGGHFGAYGLLQGGALPYEARAVEPTACALVAAETFARLAERNPAFRDHMQAEVQRYVRQSTDDIDASGAFLLFDTTLDRVLRAEATAVDAAASVRDAAQAMAAASADAVVIVDDGAPVGVVTEGDLVERVLAAGLDAATPVMRLVERPPIALRSDERLFDAIRTMMRHRVRRLVVTDARSGALVGLLSSEDVGHFRGLDPVATTERVERAATVDELAALRADHNRRLFRLHHQGVHAEDLLDVVAEVDDQVKQRALALVEAELRAGWAGAAPAEGTWAWLAFGPAGRREGVLRAFQDNGIVYADPPAEHAEAHAAFVDALAERATAALETCGYAPSELGLSAAHAAFRMPLAAWRDAYAAWASADRATATARAGAAFDLRAIYGDDGLADALRAHLRALLPAPRLAAVLAREGTLADVPLSTFGRFDVEKSPEGPMGVDLRARAITPVVQMARGLALDLAVVDATGTFERLRRVGASEHALAETARELLPALTTLVDLHLRSQMQAAETGAPPSNFLDPEGLTRSQQNLLREALLAVRKAQGAVRKHYGLG